VYESKRKLSHIVILSYQASKVKNELIIDRCFRIFSVFLLVVLLCKYCFMGCTYWYLVYQFQSEFFTLLFRYWKYNLLTSDRHLFLTLLGQCI